MIEIVQMIIVMKQFLKLKKLRMLMMNKLMILILIHVEVPDSTVKHLTVLKIHNFLIKEMISKYN